MAPGHRIVIGEAEIQARIETLADEIMRTATPEIGAVVLAGAFVFAADLMRALAKRGLSLDAEFLWLSRYGKSRQGAGDIVVLAGPGEHVRDRHVLVMDGILDRGHTLAKACAMLRQAGAASVAIAVAVERGHAEATITADFAMFRGLEGFLIGYGMDDAGADRGLPYIARLD
jgi:hypoxanthine phosphoribosyltransferase